MAIGNGINQNEGKPKSEARMLESDRERVMIWLLLPRTLSKTLQSRPAWLLSEKKTQS